MLVCVCGIGQPDGEVPTLKDIMVFLYWLLRGSSPSVW